MIHVMKQLEWVDVRQLGNASSYFGNVTACLIAQTDMTKQPVSLPTYHFLFAQFFH